MKRIICFLLTVIMLVGMIPMSATAEDYELPFIDVKEGYWFYDAVEYCVDKGYIVGMTDTTFVPNGNLTRAQFLTILAKLDGVDLTAYEGKDSGFNDVKTNHWWNAVICWAVENGITSGLSETKFGPSNDVTRAQLARFFYVYTEKTGGDVNGSADISGYPDAAKVANWAKTPVEWAVSVGLISGVKKSEVNYLDPNGTATRAQAAVMFMNYDQLEPVELNGRIIFWGDSLTQGILTGFGNVAEVPYPERVGEILGVDIKNYGIGAEVAKQIACRMGAIPMYAYATEDEPLVIPAEGSCAISIIDDEGNDGFIGNNYLYDGVNPMMVGGVLGELSKVGDNLYYFTRLEAGEEVTLTECTRVQTIGMMDRQEDDVIVIWVGHNDQYPAEGLPELLETIDAMIEYADTDEYLVLGLMGERYVPDYAELNAGIKAHLEEMGVGEKFLDVRTYLADPQHLVDLGIEPNKWDIEWMEKGWIPESLQAEKMDDQGYSLHLNQQGYDLLAAYVADYIMELGYLTD